MDHSQENGVDKVVCSTNNTLLTTKQQVSTVQNQEKMELVDETEALSVSDKSEKPEKDGIKSGQSEISYSDITEPTTLNEQQNGENFKKMNIEMGKQLTDDIIDAYCDKLQECINREVDGMLAMQYILLEPDSIKNLIKGDRNIYQVIYDHCRSHYLVLFWNKLNPKRIIVYDPIVPNQSSVLETLNDSVREQILVLFGHLYQDDEIVEIAIETGLSTQNDCWSCGLRAVAFITHLLLGINPVNYEYDLEKVGKFVMEIIKMDKPNFNVIANEQFSHERNDSKSCLKIVCVTKDDNFSITNKSINFISKHCSMEMLISKNEIENAKQNNYLCKSSESIRSCSPVSIKSCSPVSIRSYSSENLSEDLITVEEILSFISNQ